MKIRNRMLSFMLCLGLTASMIPDSAINASSKTAKLYNTKDAILDAEKYDLTYDTNNDGVLNVFDAIRARKEVVSGVTYSDLEDKVKQLEQQVEILLERLTKNEKEVNEKVDKDHELVGSLVGKAFDEKEKFEAEISENMDAKVDKEEGKGLSSNDFTDEEKSKLEGLHNYDDTEIKKQLEGLHNYDDTEIKKQLEDLHNYDDTEIREKLDSLSNYDDTALKDGKVDKEEGKGLSSNDFTDEDKAKLERVNAEVANLKSDFSALSSLLEISTEWYENAYVKENGDYCSFPDGENRKYWASHDIDITSFKSLKFNSIISYAFFDKNGALISASSAVVSPTLITVNVPANATTFRYTKETLAFNYDTKLYGGIKDDLSETVIHADDNDYDYSVAFTKTICVGDSLTHGCYYRPDYRGVPIKEGWPYMFERLINGDVTNLGHGGASATSWYKEDMQKISDYTVYDSAIIWLGTNYGLTDTLDSDVNPYTDYNDFADTNTGNYCKIIEKLKQANPEICIVLCTVFITGGGASLSDTNITIKKIAEKYNLPVIDMSDLNHQTIISTENVDSIHPFDNWVHFGKAGNIFIANRIHNELNKYFKEDISRCEFLTPHSKEQGDRIIP